MADILVDIFRRIFLKEFFFYSNFTVIFPKGRIDNKPALIMLMAWRRTGDKLLSEPMVA